MTEDIIQNEIINDDSGYIDIEFYVQKINTIVRGCCLEMGTDKPDTNQLNAFLRVAFTNLFKRRGALMYEKQCRIEYNTENISRLLEIYKRIAETWNALPSRDAFERLTGIPFVTVEQYVTGASLFIQNTRKSYIQNRLNNTPIGILALANNDIDTGLLYTRQNIVAHEAVKKSLSFDDLKRIAQGVNTPDNVTNGHNEPIDSESN